MNLMDRVMDIHEKFVVFDSHCDRIMTLMPEEPKFGSPPPKLGRSLGGHLDLLKEGGIDVQIYAVYIDPRFHPIALRKSLQMIDVFQEEAKKLEDRISVCKSYGEVVDAVEAGKHAGVLAVEGGESLMGDLKMVSVFHKLGVRSMGLTHFPRNRLGDGSAESSSNSGLSGFGISVVEEINRLKMVLDVSHINEKGFWEALELSKAPAIASHSNCKALCDHHRNLTDEQIVALGEKGGTMGITYVAPFLEMQADPMDFSSAGSSVERVLDHVDHAVELIGSEHVGLGSDYNGSAQTKIRGLEDISKTPNVTKGLVERGYSDADIENLLGGSFLRVLKQVL